VAALGDLVLEPRRLHEQLLQGERRLLGLGERLGIEAESPFFERQQGEQGLLAAQTLPAGAGGLSVAQLESSRAARGLHPQDAGLADLFQILQERPERVVGEIPLQDLKDGRAVGEEAVEP
jgi:hypothetical protein